MIRNRTDEKVIHNYNRNYDNNIVHRDYKSSKNDTHRNHQKDIFMGDVCRNIHVEKEI